jgi:Tol biopolymer transport system component
MAWKRLVSVLLVAGFWIWSASGGFGESAVMRGVRVSEVALSPGLLAARTLLAASASQASLPPLSASGGGVIAFVSERGGNQDLFIMNADGSDQRPLTSNPAQDGWASWSPDGSQMAFQSSRSGAFNLYVVDVVQGSSFDESAARRITTGSSVGGSWEPAWSPDGLRIVYSAKQTRGSDLFLVHPDGKARERLTNNSSTEGCPTWSPDGKRIAFFSDRDGNWEIYVIDADGSEETRLTNQEGKDYAPAWSPDGTRIAFISSRDGNEEIYVMGADGSHPTRLTENEAEDWFPAWSPDGERIAFSSNPDGNHEIYVMNADGSGETRLTENPAEDYAPAWRPMLP